MTLDTNIDTRPITADNRPFILQPLPLSVQMLPVLGTIFIIAGISGCALALWNVTRLGGMNFMLLAGGSFGLIFLGTVATALYHLVKASIVNTQINAFRGKLG